MFEFGYEARLGKVITIRFGFQNAASGASVAGV